MPLVNGRPNRSLMHLTKRTKVPGAPVKKYTLSDRILRDIANIIAHCQTSALRVVLRQDRFPNLAELCRLDIVDDDADELVGFVVNTAAECRASVDRSSFSALFQRLPLDRRSSHLDRTAEQYGRQPNPFMIPFLLIMHDSCPNAPKPAVLEYFTSAIRLILSHMEPDFNAQLQLVLAHVASFVQQHAPTIADRDLADFAGSSIVPIIADILVDKEAMLLSGSVFASVVLSTSPSSILSVAEQLSLSPPAPLSSFNDAVLSGQGSCAVLAAIIDQIDPESLSHPAIVASALPRVLEFCYYSDPTLRVIALTALSRYFHRISLEQSIGGDDSVRAMTNAIIDAILDMWDRALHQSERIVKQILLSYCKLVQFHDAETCLSMVMAKYRSIGHKSRSKWQLLTLIVDCFDISTTSKAGLISELLSTAGNAQVWSITRSVLNTLLRQLHDSLTPSEFTAIWLSPLCDVLVQSTNALVLDHLNADIVPDLIRLQSSAYPDLIESLRAASPSCIRDLAMIRISSSARQAGTPFAAITSVFNELQSSLQHQQEPVRICALSLVCSAPQKAEMPSALECDLVADCIPSFRNVTCSAIRHKLDRNLQVFLSRISLGSTRVFKSCRSPCTSPFIDNVVVPSSLHVPYEFVRRFFSRTLSNIFPGASVDRLLTNLQLLYIVTDIWPDWRDPNAVDAVLSAAVSSWENVRAAANAVLEKVVQSSHILPGYSAPQHIEPLFDWALHLVCSPRPSRANSGADLIGFLFNAYVVGQRWRVAFDNDRVRIADHDHCEESSSGMDFLSRLLALLRDRVGLIEQSSIADRYRSESHRVHGLMTSIANIVNQQGFHTHIGPHVASDLVTVVKRVIDVSMEVHAKESGLHWDLIQVQSIDCRGHVILDESFSADSAQLLVICSWHAIKEGANLIATLVRSGLLDLVSIQSLGLYFLHILQLCKHQGILMNMYLSFQILCQSAPIGTVSSWLDKLIDDLNIGDGSQWIRRSAGIPFCFQAILYSERKRNQKRFLCRTMDLLLKISGDMESSWSVRVHALNIVRVLVNDSELNSGICQYLSRAMLIAISGFSCEQWAVRNSSLMLFAALVRLSCPSSITARQFFTAYPDLHPFFLSQLDLIANSSSTSDQLHPSVYPILLIMSRLSTCSSSTDVVSPFLPYIAHYTSHPVYIIREQAGKSLSCVHPDLRSYAQYLALNSLPSSDQFTSISHNTLHGVLIQLHHISSRIADLALDPVLIASRLYLAGPFVKSHVVRRAALAVFQNLIPSSAASSNASLLIQYALEICMDKGSGDFNGIGYNQMRETAAELIVKWNHLICEPDRQSALISSFRTFPSCCTLITPSSIPISYIVSLCSSCADLPISDIIPMIELIYSRDSYLYDLTLDQRDAIRDIAGLSTDPCSIRLYGYMQSRYPCPSFLNTISRGADSAQEPDIRHAACQAIVSAGIAGYTGANEIGLYWTTAIKLILDNDDMIRSLALSLIPSSARYAATPIHRLFLYFAHQYSDRHHLHQPLWNMLITIINQYSHGPDTLGLFEPDKDNDHIENILLAQLICSLIKDSMSSVHKQSLAKQATIELSALVSSNTRALSSDLPLSDGLIEAMFISMIAVIAVGGEIGAVLSDIIPSLCKYPILNHAINHNYLFLLGRSLN